MAHFCCANRTPEIFEDFTFGLLARLADKPGFYKHLIRMNKYEHCGELLHWENEAFL